MIPSACLHCGTPLRRTGAGRPPRYCSPAHRVAAHRSRPGLPVELTSRDRWVRYSATKVPLQVATHRAASSTNPATWTSYLAAIQSTRGVGAGFVLDGDGIVCIDLDHCLHNGRLAPWAADVLQRCPRTFVEVSHSGTGLHVWGRGEVGIARVIRDGVRKVEVYGQGRYIATTGCRWRGAPLRLADVSAFIDSLTMS